VVIRDQKSHPHSRAGRSKVIRSQKTGPFETEVFRATSLGREGRKTVKASKLLEAQKVFILKKSNGDDGSAETEGATPIHQTGSKPK
jgi:hypothetical protein